MKQKNTSKKDSKEFMHVKISNPITLRKEILTNAIAVTKLMQNQNDLVMLKYAKKALLDDLRTLRNDISLEENKLFQLLPKIQEEHHEEKEIPLELPKEHHDIDKLKKELAEIEEKLENLK